jgi:hypothetical protein
MQIVLRIFISRLRRGADALCELAFKPVLRLRDAIAHAIARPTC